MVMQLGSATTKSQHIEAGQTHLRSWKMRELGTHGDSCDNEDLKHSRNH